MHPVRGYYRTCRSLARRTRGGLLIAITTTIVLASGCQQPIARTPILKPPRPAPISVSGKTVVIDAGHGGRDFGAPGVGPLVEKHVNLSIAMRVAALLQRRGVHVITTRRDDTFIPLNDRALAADRYVADLLVSIHADSAPNSRATGATVYIAKGALGASENAANRIGA